MPKLLSVTFVALVTLCLSGIAAADSIAETFTCTVEEGKKIANARITVWHNDVLIHDDVELENKGTGDDTIVLDNYRGADP